MPIPDLGLKGFCNSPKFDSGIKFFFSNSFPTQLLHSYTHRIRVDAGYLKNPKNCYPIMILIKIIQIYY